MFLNTHLRMLKIIKKSKFKIQMCFYELTQILLDWVQFIWGCKDRGESSSTTRIFYKKWISNKEGKRIKALATTVFGGLRYQADSHLLRGWIDEPTATLATSTGGYRRLQQRAARVPAVTEKRAARARMHVSVPSS